MLNNISRVTCKFISDIESQPIKKSDAQVLADGLIKHFLDGTPGPAYPESLDSYEQYTVYMEAKRVAKSMAVAV